MTLTPNTDRTDAPPVEMVNLTIDDVEVSVPKGTLVIRAAELIGVQIPRFCDHPLLDPVGACRQCLVEVEGQRKPMASCTITCTPDMVVRTQYTSEAADKAQHGVMELLLINHPLDCPVCDKGGECPLQNQAMSNGRAETRFEDVKRTFPKPINISSRGAAGPRTLRAVRALHPVLRPDRRRPLHRAARTRCAATGRHRPRRAVRLLLLRQHRADLPGRCADRRRVPVPGPAVRPGVQPQRVRTLRVGCAQRTDHRRGKVMRRLAGDDPEVNEEWNCDKGRWAFTYATQGDRITTPLVRDDDGTLRPASWSEAIARGGRRPGRGRAAAPGFWSAAAATVEDAYAYAEVRPNGVGHQRHRLPRPRRTAPRRPSSSPRMSRASR